MPQTRANADDRLHALGLSVARLRSIVEPLTADQVSTPAYPSEWTVADVLSHVGSGAVIQLARLDAGLAGRTLADDFVNPIWDEWNAKSPEAKVTDGLAADRASVERLASLNDDERARAKIVLGPIELDFAGLVGFRLNEHALHTWDVEVVFDSSAAVPPEAARFVVDNLALIVGFVGKPTGAEHDVHIRTTEPDRNLTLALGPKALSLGAADGSHEPDLELPAEAFVRLVYGRLDPDHTPPVRGRADLDELRRAFPGV
jgi:uncharacterized protein (TIGR03083 family)